MQEKLYDRVIEYYDSQNWKYSTDVDDNGRNIVKMSISAKGIDSVNVMTVITDGSICTYTYFPINIPEDKRALIAEYITRANYGLKTGCFEMDLNDGEIRYKVFSLWDDDVVPTLDIVERYVDMGFMMMSRYGETLMKVIYGGLTPEEAIQMAEEE